MRNIAAGLAALGVGRGDTVGFMRVALTEGSIRICSRVVTAWSRT